MVEQGGDRAARRFMLFAALLLLLALGLGAQELDTPGLYYDEAVQARPAREFVTGIVYATPFPGSRTIDVAGRPFPWMTQPYMGALKSQVLIPSVWLFGSSVIALRATTLLWALAGVALIAAFARRAFGETTAGIALLLLAFDPSLLLLGRHDWGSIALSLLLRGAVFFGVWRWWETRSTAWLAAGSFAIGLGLYNKIDFSVFLAGAGIGVLACAAKPLFARLRSQPRDLAIAGGGLLLGLLPLLPSVASVLAARNAFRQEGEAAEKLHTFWTMLDGSYFARLMEVGGLFDRMQQTSGAPSSLFGAAFAIALPVAVVLAWRARRDPGSRATHTAGVFLISATLASLLAYAALPGGVRIHHAFNVYPYPQLLVAWTLACIAQHGGRARATAFAVAALLAISSGVTTARTIRASAEAQGHGRWSHAMNDLARELDSNEAVVIVSLDWGFHENFGFLTKGPRLIDAYPRIPSAIAQRGAWRVEGTAGHVYLLHEEPYDLFGYGAPFLHALEAVDPEKQIVTRHTDGSGALAFTSVRFRASHRVVFRPGGFEIQVD